MCFKEEVTQFPECFLEASVRWKGDGENKVGERKTPKRLPPRLQRKKRIGLQGSENPWQKKPRYSFQDQGKGE